MKFNFFTFGGAFFLGRRIFFTRSGESRDTAEQKPTACSTHGISAGPAELLKNVKKPLLNI